MLKVSVRGERLVLNVLNALVHEEARHRAHIGARIALSLSYIFLKRSEILYNDGKYRFLTKRGLIRRSFRAIETGETNIFTLTECAFNFSCQ